MVHRGISSMTAKVRFTPPAQATNPVEEPTAQPKEGDDMLWLLAIIQLLPVIANGVHAVKTDISLKEKQKAASDILTTAIAGATVAVPAEDQPMVAQASEIAQVLLSDAVAKLHVTGTPATNPAAPESPTGIVAAAAPAPAPAATA